MGRRGRSPAHGLRMTRARRSCRGLAWGAQASMNWEPINDGKILQLENFSGQPPTD